MMNSDITPPKMHSGPEIATCCAYMAYDCKDQAGSFVKTGSAA